MKTYRTTTLRQTPPQAMKSRTDLQGQIHCRAYMNCTQSAGERMGTILTIGCKQSPR
jgi:hypothetical protein